MPAMRTILSILGSERKIKSARKASLIIAIVVVDAVVIAVLVVFSFRRRRRRRRRLLLLSTFPSIVLSAFITLKRRYSDIVSEECV